MVNQSLFSVYFCYQVVNSLLENGFPLEMLMKKLSTALFITMILSLISACGNGDLTESNAASYRYRSEVSIWYVDDHSGLWNNLDDLMEEYNASNGKEHVITVSAQSFKDDKSLVDALLDEEHLPSLVMCSGDTASYLNHIGIPSHTGTAFKDWQMSRFDSDYLNSGIIDGSLYCVPMAASPDILIINNALVEGVSSYRQETLSTLEGLGVVAADFTKETGTPFFSSESFSGMIRTGMAEFGETFHASRQTDISCDYFKYVYNVLAQIAFNRAMVVSEEDPSEMVLSGTVPCVCVSAESFMKHAGELDPSAITILPAPRMQEGNGSYILHFCSALITGSSEKEQAASAEFLSWLVANGDSFTADSGFFPTLTVNEGESHSSRISGNNDIYRLIARAFSQQEQERPVFYPENNAEYYQQVSDFEADYRTRLLNLIES